MHKSWILILLVAALALTGCAQTAAPAPTTSVTATPVPAKPTAANVPAMACQVGSMFTTPVDPQSIHLTPISDQDWSRGPETATMTILEYSDFQCPACAQAGPLIKQFEDDNPGEVREVYRHFPLSQHDKSILAAQAAEAAGLQDKFWEMHDFLFDPTNWAAWSMMSSGDFENWLYDNAASLSLDVDRFKQDIHSDEVVARVKEDQQQGIDIALFQTPSLIIFLGNDLIFTHNDQIPYSPETLQAILDVAKIRPKQFDACPPMTVDPAKTYTATIQTEIGDITLKLYPDKAPLAVNNFIFLARQGFYDGVTFHRVLPGYIAQAGDPSGTGLGGPGYSFANETTDDLTFDRAGLLGMANSGADTNGSQFFITFEPISQLNGNYTIFGEVTSGMDVAEKLTARDPTSSSTTSLPQGTLIKTILIEEN